MEISSDLLFNKLIAEIKSENIKSFHIPVYIYLILFIDCIMWHIYIIKFYLNYPYPYPYYVRKILGIMKRSSLK